ncbi:MAG: hypothetical protein LBK66_10460 [Spirochaetaceae bacterium]|jgi:hypothetical protein|nr:hypothetical protein [Spirochaetaceae bacterium]
MKEKQSNRINAKVVLCKCPKNKRVYGMRLEEQGGDWVRTWAFKLDEAAAKREGFDTETTRGTMRPTLDYPGCPYCGGTSLNQCKCGKIFCGKAGEATCPWCGTTSTYSPVDRLSVQGGGL